MIIAVDFDGTCVKHAYPKIGADIGAGPVLHDLHEQGHQLILWTMRSGDLLADAVRWFSERKISLWGVNQNPEQLSWTGSPKAFATLYIDDAAFGCPLKKDSPDERPYVDWTAVQVALIAQGVLNILKYGTHAHGIPTPKPEYKVSIESLSINTFDRTYIMPIPKVIQCDECQRVLNGNEVYCFKCGKTFCRTCKQRHEV